jgi:H+/Cl- antiporter ClcA
MIEGMLSQSDQPNFTETGVPSTYSVRFWVVALIVGIGAGLTGGLLMKLLRLVQHAAWSYSTGDFLVAVRLTSAPHRVTVLILAGVLTGIALWIFRRFQGKTEGGLSSGIWFRQGEVPLFDMLYNGILSITIVGLGAALGREAAPKEISAAITSKLSDLTKLSHAQRKILVACGAGAGMAAVYNVPFGGALFALEVLLGSLALPNVLPALAISFVATWTSWLLLPASPTYTVPAYDVSTGLLVGSVLFGPIAGILSVGYVRTIGWARSHKPDGLHQITVPIAVFAILGVTAIKFPELLGNGKNVVQEIIVGNPGMLLLAGLLVLRPLATAACLRSGAPGGLFTPTLTFGALLGALAGHAWMAIWPGIDQNSLGAYAVIGTGAILASATQGPLSAIVLMLELGAHTDALIMPLLIATAGATLVSRRLEPRSIYSITANAKPLLASNSL